MSGNSHYFWIPLSILSFFDCPILFIREIQILNVYSSYFCYVKLKTKPCFYLEMFIIYSCIKERLELYEM